MYKDPVNDGINYQHQLVQKFKLWSNLGLGGLNLNSDNRYQQEHGHWLMFAFYDV